MQRFTVIEKQVLPITDAILRKCHRCGEIYPLNKKHFKERTDGTGWLNQCMTCFARMRIKQRSKSKR